MFELSNGYVSIILEHLQCCFSFCDDGNCIFYSRIYYLVFPIGFFSQLVVLVFQLSVLDRDIVYYCLFKIQMFFEFRYVILPDLMTETIKLLQYQK